MVDALDHLAVGLALVGVVTGRPAVTQCQGWMEVVMGWQSRGGKQKYYYSTMRIGDRFINVYLGNGELARSFAAIKNHVADLKRQARDVAREARDGTATESTGVGPESALVDTTPFRSNATAT